MSSFCEKINFDAGDLNFGVSINIYENWLYLEEPRPFTS